MYLNRITLAHTARCTIFSHTEVTDQFRKHYDAQEGAFIPANALKKRLGQRAKV